MSSPLTAKAVPRWNNNSLNHNRMSDSLFVAWIILCLKTIVKKWSWMSLEGSNKAELLSLGEVFKCGESMQSHTFWPTLRLRDQKLDNARFSAKRGSWFLYSGYPSWHLIMMWCRDRVCAEHRERGGGECRTHHMILMLLCFIKHEQGQYNWPKCSRISGMDAGQDTWL